MSQYTDLLAQLDALSELPDAVRYQLRGYARAMQYTHNSGFAGHLAGGAESVCRAFGLAELVPIEPALALGRAFERFARYRQAVLEQRAARRMVRA